MLPNIIANVPDCQINKIRKYTNNTEKTDKIINKFILWTLVTIL